MEDKIATPLPNEEISENVFFKNYDNYREESADNNSFIILAILTLIAGFVVLAAFVLINMR